MKDKKQTGIYILIGVLALIIIVIAVLAVKRRQDAMAGQQTPEAGQTAGDGDVEKWQEGAVRYQDKVYLYNSSIKTYLFLGIDNTGTIDESSGGFSGGQSDAMFLLVTNEKDKSISVISIHRNTMAMVDIYDLLDNRVDRQEMQICLQYAQGDGARTSCLYTVDAVSRLFYQLPINGYLSLNMDGIPILNDAVGGVTVEVLDDLKNESLGVSLTKGETVTLNGDEAYVYIRSRDIDEFDSATRRLERQNQYLLQLFGQINGSMSKTSIVSAYNKIEDYLVTNIDFVELAEDTSEYTFDESRMYMIPGETVMGEVYEEYYVDDTALYEMILDIFYEEVTE